MLTRVLDRPVIDQTGIAGKFDIHLDFAPERTTLKFLLDGDVPPFAEAASDRAGPSIFTAIQDLGLKLDPAQGPSEFLVIDHVERPTEH